MEKMKVEVVEVGPRDGFQMEPEFIPTDEKVRYIERLARCGFPAMEVVSFIGPRAIPQMADAEAVLERLDPSLGTVFRGLVPNERGADRAARAGVGEMVPIVSASESHNRANLNRTIDQTVSGLEAIVAIAASASIPVHGGIATAFGCPFEGEVAPERVLGIGQAMWDMGIRAVTLGDTTGMATPKAVAAVCVAFSAACPEMRLSLHFHNTRGIGLVNVATALRLGIRSFESSVGGLGGCPFAPKATGNICTEDLINLLNEMDVETGISLDPLIEVACDLERRLDRGLPGQVMKSGPRLSLHPLASVQVARA
jgi:hydroxymethylglutaryl-CoA lyase